MCPLAAGSLLASAKPDRLSHASARPIHSAYQCGSYIHALADDTSNRDQHRHCHIHPVAVRHPHRKRAPNANRYAHPTERKRCFKGQLQLPVWPE